MNTTTNTKTPAVSAAIDLATMGMVLTFGNGKTLTIQARDLNDNIVAHATMHGLKQKLIDAAAISRNTDTGKPATVEDKYAAVCEVFGRLIAGQWNATREGGSTGGMLVGALVRLYNKTPEQIRKFLESKTDAEKTALRKNPKVAAMIETIRAESGKAANVDTDALLDELGGE
jgi:hypothetical protein